VEHIERHQPKAEEMTKRRVDLTRSRTSRAYRYNLPLGMEDDGGLIPLLSTKSTRPYSKLNSNRHPPGTSHNTSHLNPNPIESSWSLQAQHMHLQKTNSALKRLLRRCVRGVDKVYLYTVDEPSSTPTPDSDPHPPHRPPHNHQTP
jgi:hypothetical protein